jgi:mono/diheme cytochrome c family protein
MNPARVLLLTAVTACLTLSAADAQKGKATYDKVCRACHGAQGQGNPAIAKSLKITLRDLGSKEVQAKTDEQLMKDAAGGTEKKKPVKAATKEQLPDVIAFVRTLAKK